MNILSPEFMEVMRRMNTVWQLHGLRHELKSHQEHLRQFKPDDKLVPIIKKCIKICKRDIKQIEKQLKELDDK